MKKKLLLSTLLSFVFYLLSSQIPQGFNYQAIARKSDGTAITNTPLPVRLSILSDTSGFYATGGGIYVWEEEQSATTNNLGLFNLVLGNASASKIQGSASSFNAINWKTVPLFIGTKIYYEGSWKFLGSPKLWSVPYSMISGDLAAPLKKLAVAGETSVMDEALFEVRNKNGQTVFAVYNEGVRVYVADGVAKGATKGGFAIGGFDQVKGTQQNYFIVSPDSIRAYINPSPTGKGATKGGFAIGGFDQVKAPKLEYLRVTKDSTRVNVNRLAKGTKGGFAIGGFDEVKTAPSYFLSLTPENYFIGENSGSKTANGLYNSFLGYEAGKENTDGTSNVFIGYNSGYLNTTGNTNLFLGYKSGYHNINGSQNVFLGDYSGYSNVGGEFGWPGSNNIFIGSNAGKNNSSGGSNIFIGTSAGFTNDIATLNLYIGDHSGEMSKGFRNTFLGAFAGQDNSTGEDNIFIGPLVGQHSSTGNGNTFIGATSGWNNGVGEDNTYIGKYSGGNLVSGIQNTFLGNASGIGSTTGSYNVFLGSYAGGQNNGSRNVFLGYYAGNDETGSDKLYIENSSLGSDNALIYGEFDNDLLKLNASVKIRDVLKLQPRSTDPPNPEMGDIYFNSATKKLMVYDGTTWQACW